MRFHGNFAAVCVPVPVAWLLPQPMAMSTSTRAMVLLALLCLPSMSVAHGFDDFATCQACVAAGHGWSVAKSKCGGFSNRVCPAAAAVGASVGARDAKYAAIWQALDTAERSCGDPCTSARECFFARIERDLTGWRRNGGVTKAQARPRLEPARVFCLSRQIHWQQHHSRSGVRGAASISHPAAQGHVA